MSVLVDPVTPQLWRACLAGDAALIQQEVHAGHADPHTLDRNGETCLHMAARGGNTKALEAVLDEGLRLDQSNHNGQTALHVAVNLDNLSIVRAIAQYGGDLDLTTRYSEMTALHLACRHGHQEIVQCLLDCGANCAIKDKIKQWPDFYTSDQTILKAFDEHFEVCTHGRRKPHGAQTNTNLLYNTALLDSALSSLDYSGTAHTSARPKGGNEGVERDSAGVAILDDNTEMEKLRAQERHQRDRDGPEYGNIQHGSVEIFDEKATYDPDTDAAEAGTLRRNDKKWKINHKMDFSDQHKKRMQQNVFDRLLGPNKKK